MTEKKVFQKNTSNPQTKVEQNPIYVGPMQQHRVPKYKFIERI